MDGSSMRQIHPCLSKLDMDSSNITEKQKHLECVLDNTHLSNEFIKLRFPNGDIFSLVDHLKGEVPKSKMAA